MRGDELCRALEDRVLLLDGGLGSLLIAQGLPAGRAPEWWLLEHPDRVADAHRRYAQAGCDVIHTATFGASPPKLQAAGLPGRCREINRLATSIARTAAGPGVLVAGDVGPTGRLFPPMGNATAGELRDAFAEQMAALADAGADVISIETMYDAREALAAVEVARETGLAVLAAMTFDAKKRGFFTLVGDRIGPTLLALRDAGADVVGINCGVRPEEMVPMMEEACREVGGMLHAQPNAGPPHATPEGVAYDASAEGLAESLLRMVRAGVRMVGGCCGTTPEMIATVRRALPAGGP